MLHVRDIQEKDVGQPQPPSLSAPSPNDASTRGFPAHKKRTRISAFKQRQKTPTELASAPRTLGDWVEEDRQRIDRENQEKLGSMSPEDIMQAQRDLMQNMDPAVLQVLLKRANIDDPKSSNDAPFRPSSPRAKPPEIQIEDTTTTTPTDDATTTDTRKTAHFDPDLTAPPHPQPADLPRPTPPATHFPSGPTSPDLDPSDPDFLVHLHEKYFPNLLADPNKLAWMAPLPTPDSLADRDSPYHPAHTSLAPSQLRFDFTGALLAPRTSRALPATRGMHHHADAPEAAGYTIPELARLARSTVAGQRCIAFQTLGRVIYRLGRGEFGRGEHYADGGTSKVKTQRRIGGAQNGDGHPSSTHNGDDDDDDDETETDLATALWRLIKQCRVLTTLEEVAAMPEGAGHRSVRAYAIEALWLFEKGGWKETWRGR